MTEPERKNRRGPLDAGRAGGAMPGKWTACTALGAGCYAAG